jgi:putative transcriptional regulator
VRCCRRQQELDRNKDMSKQYHSRVLASVHETTEGLTGAGAMSKQMMREFDELCLAPAGCGRRQGRGSAFRCRRRLTRPAATPDLQCLSNPTIGWPSDCGGLAFRPGQVSVG